MNNTITELQNGDFEVNNMPDEIYTSDAQHAQIGGVSVGLYISSKPSGRTTEYIRKDLYDTRVTELLENNNKLVEEVRLLKLQLDRTIHD